MTNELTVQSLGDAVKDKVRKAMMDAIPDESLQVLIKSEFNRFFQDKKANSYDREPSLPSDFKNMVRKEVESAMSEKLKASIRELVNLTNNDWDAEGKKAIKTLVEEMAPHAMAGIMKDIAYECVNNIKNRGY